MKCKSFLLDPIRRPRPLVDLIDMIFCERISWWLCAENLYQIKFELLNVMLISTVVEKLLIMHALLLKTNCAFFDNDIKCIGCSFSQSRCFFQKSGCSQIPFCLSLPHVPVQSYHSLLSLSLPSSLRMSSKETLGVDTCEREEQQDLYFVKILAQSLETFLWVLYSVCYFCVQCYSVDRQYCRIFVLQCRINLQSMLIVLVHVRI